MVGGLGAFFLFHSKEAVTAELPPEELVAKTESANARSKKHPQQTPRLAIEPTEIAEGPKPQPRDLLPPRTAKLSSRERRPGEAKDDFDLRISFLDRFDRFVEQAELTPEQIPLVLERIADAQEQSEIGWQAFSESTRTVDGEVVDLGDMAKTFRADFYGSMRDVLSREQMERFLRTAIITGPLTFGVYRPLDIERAALQ